MSLASPALVHAALPLAVLESVQGLDAPVDDGLDEYHADLAAKRLGRSQTVAAQIARFARLARGGEPVDDGELVALLRLVGRRSDAGLVFTDAGRRAGRHAVRRIGVSFQSVVRALPRALRNRAGFQLAQRGARSVFGGVMRRDAGTADATVRDAPSVRAIESGLACAFYGAGFAELLRQLTDFDGAMIHVNCRARGDAECVWRAAPHSERETEEAA